MRGKGIIWISDLDLGMAVLNYLRLNLRMVVLKLYGVAPAGVGLMNCPCGRGFN